MLFIYTYIIQLKCGVQVKKRNEMMSNLIWKMIFYLKLKTKNLRKVWSHKCLCDESYDVLLCCIK